MKKNVVLLLIDSMNYSHIKKYPFLTPFLNSIKDKNVSFENMFAQAPYTEAASMSIYCGQNVLDNGGYLFRYKYAPKTIFEAYKEKGYTTFYNYFQPQCYPSSLRRGIDSLYYDVGFDINALWSYRLYFYSELLNEGKITEADYKTLIELLDDNFIEWIEFNNEIIENKQSVEFIRDNCLNYDAESIASTIKDEYGKYSLDKRAYIDDLLKKKTSHKLFEIKQFTQDNKIKDKNFIQDFRNQYYSFFTDLKALNRRYNLKNCKGTLNGSVRKFSELIHNISRESLKNFGKSLILAMNVYNDSDLLDRIAVDYELFKNAPSIKSHIDHYFKWEKNRTDNKPSFACIHVDDIHNPEMFFTYDSMDMDLLNEEFNDAKDVINNLPNDYYGNISHDLSLRYIDSKIKYFYNQLANNGLDNNTIVLICADHGFSFSGNPLRDSFVINMYLENYNIPCIITGVNKTATINGLAASKDIPSILMYFTDDETEKSFKGQNSFLIENSYKYLFIEYCGGGCPDLKRRKLKIGCFNKEWFVASEAELDVVISRDNITELYYLKDDPLQLNNIKDTVVWTEELEEIVVAINNRKTEITESMIMDD